MARELLILNPAPFIWQHKDKDIPLPFTISKFFFDIDMGMFQIKEGRGGSGAARFPYAYDKITIKVGNGAIEGPFPNEVALLVRLRQLNYPGFIEFVNAMGLISTDANNILAIGTDGLLYVPDGAGGGSTTYISDGVNTTVTGSGTSIDPYQINASGGGGSQDLQQVTDVSPITTNDVIFGDVTSEDVRFSLIGRDGFENYDGASGKRVAFNYLEGVILRTNILGSDVNIKSDNATASYTVQMPDKSAGTETFAMLSDLGTAGAVSSVNGEFGDVVLTQDDVLDGTTYKQYSATEKTKLSGIATGATANQSDSITNAAIALKLDLAGGTLSGDVQQPGAPVNANSLINKNYVDNLVTGITWKTEVRAATTANITLSGTQTVDGISLVVGNRVLVKNQTTQSQNGIYLVASGAWTRTTDADTTDEIEGATVMVRLGTVNKDTQWTNTNSNEPVIGTDAITFGQISGAGTYTNGTGLDLIGNVFSVNASFTALKENTSNKQNSLTADGSGVKFPTVDAVNTALGLKAPLASPAFTGTPTAPTAALGTNTTQIATMAALQAAIASMPKTMETVGTFTTTATTAAQVLVSIPIPVGTIKDLTTFRIKTGLLKTGVAASAFTSFYLNTVNNITPASTLVQLSTLTLAAGTTGVAPERTLSIDGTTLSGFPPGFNSSTDATQGTTAVLAATGINFTTTLYYLIVAVQLNSAADSITAKYLTLQTSK